MNEHPECVFLMSLTNLFCNEVQSPSFFGHEKITAIIYSEDYAYNKLLSAKRSEPQALVFPLGISPGAQS